MEKIATILVFLLCALNLVPPMFAESGYFGGIYFDNVYYLILFVLLSSLGLFLPFCAVNLNKWTKRVSFVIGSWYSFALVAEVVNFATPAVVFNSASDYTYFSKYLIIFTISISFIITHESWMKHRS